MRIAITGYAHPLGEGLIYGAERIIWYLIQELKRMGHECVVFSVEGTNVPGFDLITVPKCWEDEVDLYWNAIQCYGHFDMIHSYQASGLISDQMRERPYCLEPFMIFHRWPQNIIAYSNRLSEINGGQSTTIYFGLPEQQYPTFEKDPDDYLVWIGRMDMGKAPAIAIEVAKRAGKRLIMMGPAYHYPYFVDNIWPLIDDDQIIWLRAVDDTIKQRVFRKALGFLSTNWDQYCEMFGIVNIEALATGCPVIGWGNRNNPSAINYQGGEIIVHGEQGFINEYADYSDAERERAIEAGVAYVNDLHLVDRSKCYQLFKDRFTTSIMAENHLKYFKIIQERGTVGNVTGELG